MTSATGSSGGHTDRPTLAGTRLSDVCCALSACRKSVLQQHMCEHSYLLQSVQRHLPQPPARKLHLCSHTGDTHSGVASVSVAFRMRAHSKSHKCPSAWGNAPAWTARAQKGHQAEVIPPTWRLKPHLLPVLCVNRGLRGGAEARAGKDKLD